MKAFFLCLCTIFFFHATQAQEGKWYIANKYCAKKDSLVVFEGGNNLIQVYNTGMKGADLKIKSMDHSLRMAPEELKGDTVTAWVMPYAVNKKMKLAIVNKKTGKTLKEVYFVAEKLPEPRARIGKLTDTVIDKKDLLHQSTISVWFPNSLYGYPYHILSYKFHTKYGDKSATLPVNGTWITTEVLQEIKDVPANTIVEFKEIKCTCPECAIRVLPDLHIKVKG